MKKELICISCPMGCHLIVDTETLIVSGNTCKRGEIYGKNEVTNPVRVITTTAKVENGTLAVIPVKTNGAIPKELNFKCVEEINKLKLKAPIHIGDILIKNIFDTGIDVIACRNISLK